MKPFSIFALIGAFLLMAFVLAGIFQPEHLASGIDKRGNIFGSMLTRLLNNNSDIFGLLVFFAFMGVAFVVLRAAGGGGKKGD